MGRPVVTRKREAAARADEGPRTYGTHDHPVHVASADDAFLHVLVVIDAPQQQMERRNIKNPPRPRLSPAPEPVTQIT
jgi:hypothetical protein